MAAQEYDGMKEQLDLEQNLRVKAESYAHEVKGSETQTVTPSFWFTTKQNFVLFSVELTVRTVSVGTRRLLKDS